MPSILIRIKRLVLQGKYVFTQKALNEMDKDNLTEEEVIESILAAQFVRAKTSTSEFRTGRRERVYIIENYSFSGTLIYTKGAIKGKGADARYYLLISSKRSVVS